VPTEMYLYADDGHAFGRRRTKDPITEWPQLVEKWLRTIGAFAVSAGLRRLVEEIVGRVWYACFLANDGPIRGRCIAANGVEPLNERHLREQTVARGNRAEREPRDRRRVRSATIDDRAYDLRATIALPRRTGKVCCDLTVATLISVYRGRRRSGTPARTIPMVDLKADAERVDYKCASHRRRQLGAGG